MQANDGNFKATTIRRGLSAVEILCGELSTAASGTVTGQSAKLAASTVHSTVRGNLLLSSYWGSAGLVTGNGHFNAETSELNRLSQCAGCIQNFPNCVFGLTSS
ncbi:hypothetical protein QE152_g28497 [Popillia japonica]|uniref:Uncharacterized protein n=1 Tax=Popillia japonica TaxID=7064 RepID=A0AAW1JIJ8_POPJA